MPRFRPRDPSSPLCGQACVPSAVRQVAWDVIHPRNFFLASPYRLQIEKLDREELAWEIYKGRLLDPAHTRQTARFEAWNLHLIEDGLPLEPVLGVKFDAVNQRLFVVRGLECYAWEGYSESRDSNVVLSRERRKWMRELVGMIALDRLSDAEELRDELQALLFLAVVGLSRLPLTSIEAPLPLFSFGKLFYCYRETADADPISDPLALLHAMPAMPTHVEQAGTLEAFLRAASEQEAAAAGGHLREPPDVLGLLRTVYNNVALSPWTPFVERTLTFLRSLQRHGAVTVEGVVDFLGLVLRQNGRHLTAYDLVTFHHRGANYPDALLLDLVLKEYLALLEEHPRLAEGEGKPARLRRRALRQGWLLRRRYEGHAVPDAPTSPGENARVLADQPRVPEEQILQPALRKRRLFEDDPLTKYLGPCTSELLRLSLLDLEHDGELRELGCAIFLDRPLGACKSPGEPDQTPLLSAIAFSRTVAVQRLVQLAGDADLPVEKTFVDVCRARLLKLSVAGLPLDRIDGEPRPGSVSLRDARLAASDFVFLRTTSSSLASFLASVDCTPLRELGNEAVLLARKGDSLVVYDAAFQPRVEFALPAKEDLITRAGVEYPRDGLEVVRTGLP